MEFSRRERYYPPPAMVPQRPGRPQVLGPCWHCGAYGHIQAHCWMSQGRLYPLLLQPVVSTSAELGKDVSACVNSNVCSGYDNLHDKCVDSGVCNHEATRIDVKNQSKLFSPSIDEVNAEAAAIQGHAEVAGMQGHAEAADMQGHAEAAGMHDHAEAAGMLVHANRVILIVL